MLAIRCPDEVALVIVAVLATDQQEAVEALGLASAIRPVLEPGTRSG
jgi:hypothetical protein